MCYWLQDNLNLTSKSGKGYTARMIHLATKGWAARLLTLLLVAASICPPAFLWQCAHASRVVDTLVVTRATMPCQMRHPIPGMPCCRDMVVPTHRSPLSRQMRLQSPDCHPHLLALTSGVRDRIAPLPFASLPGVTHPAVASATAPPTVSVILKTLRIRPPPGARLVVSALPHACPPRAPPAA